MSRFCKKCGKEIPQSSKNDLCEYHQNELFGWLINAGKGALIVGLAALALITKSKPNGGSKT